MGNICLPKKKLSKLNKYIMNILKYMKILRFMSMVEKTLLSSPQQQANPCLSVKTVPEKQRHEQL